MKMRAPTRLVSTAFALLIVTAARARADVPAVMTYPANGAVGANLTQPITWTSVASAQAYYLYIGTSVGSKDLVNSGELQQTSYVATQLPAQQTLYARLYTKIANAWYYTDSQFSGAVPIGTITSPLNGQTNVDLTQPIRWTGVGNAQAYYLYVGTSRGAKNVVDTGEMQGTSYLATNLPTNQTLWARLHTKISGNWYSMEVSFTGSILSALITSPANGATNANFAQPITWTTVSGAQAYYLFVGTTPGAKNLIDSGETQATSYQPGNLPAGQTLYARLHTKRGGQWSYTEINFKGGLTLATVTSPVNGATAADLTQPIQWTTAPNVLAYYLYVGTTPGAKDLVNTGEIHVTSYLASNMPAGQVLYARLFTKLASGWYYTNSSFTAANLAATISSPPNGAVNANLSNPITWTSVPNAAAYYLMVGTTVGAKDVVDSGEINSTSYVVLKALPAAQTLFARLYTKLGSSWHFTDSTFSAAPLVATILYPANGSTNGDRSQPVIWSQPAGAEAYYLYVGSTPGAKDIVDSRETPRTSFLMGNVPVGTLLYARLHTKMGGRWRSVDSTFTMAPWAPRFVYPHDGAVGVTTAQPFQWTAPAAAAAHRLYVGTTPGANDVADSGELATTSYPVAALPGGTLYARVWIKLNGVWARHTDIAFTADATSPMSLELMPTNGATHVDTAQPFQWSAAPLGRAYRLTVGTTAGAADLHDSGEIRSTQRFVPNLPVGVPLFGSIHAKIDGVWYASDFSFTVTANSLSPAAQIKAGLWATNFVRQMAGEDDRAFAWTDLFPASDWRYTAGDIEYTNTLLKMLGDVNLQTAARRLNVAFNTTGSDTHALVELLADTAAGRWMVLDPLFDLAARRQDGVWATADEISQASLSSNWTAITYVMLRTGADAYARAHRLDYPLYYVNVFHAGQVVVFGQGTSPMPYLTSSALPVSGPAGAFTVQCSAGAAAANVVIDGVATQVWCDGIDSLSSTFMASTIAAANPSQPGFQLYAVRRYVF